MSQFKAGDLALVIKSFNPEKVGRTVTVLEIRTDNCTLHLYKGTKHQGMADGSPSAFIDFGEGIESVRFYDQRDLMPLRGQFTPETERETELTQ